MLEYKIDLDGLSQLLQQMSSYTSSSESEHFYSKSPRHVLAYNEILRFSKEELEQYKDRHTDNFFYHYVMDRNEPNPLFFAALIQKGAFVDKLSSLSKWFLKSTQEPSLELYALLSRIESYHFRKYEKDINKFQICSHFFSHMDTEEKKNLAEKFYNKFLHLTSSHAPMVKYCFDYPQSQYTIFLLNKINQYNIDINKNHLLNKYLPESRINDDSTFFISSSHILTIVDKLKMGFAFDENNYSYQGDSLFTALLKSKRKDLIINIVPHLKNFIPFKGTQEEQRQLVENFRGNVLYDIIKPIYYKTLLENQLEVKNSSLSHLKVKI